MHLLTFLVVSCVSGPVVGPGPGDILRAQAFAPLLAQSFGMDVDEGEKAARPEKKAKPKPKKKPAEVKNEKDLWSEPAEKAKGEGKEGDKGEDDKGEGDVEEIPEDEIEDVDTGDEGADQGKGEQVPDEGEQGQDTQRDKWGDEERIKNAESLDNEKDLPLVKKPARADAGMKKPVAQKPLPAPDAGMAKEPRPVAGGAAEETREDAGQQGEPQVAGKIRPPSGSVADLSALWEQRRIHLSQRDFELAGQDLERFLQLKEELDIRNLYGRAQVLLREALKARRAEDLKLAGKLVEAAVAAAPDMPAVYMGRASLWFAQNPLGVGRVLGALMDASRAAFADPLSLNRFLVDLITGLLMGLVLAAGIFVLVQFLRYLRLFFHDFHHLFPAGVAQLQTGFLAVLVILVPVIFRTGLVSVLIVWALIAWVYQQRRERIVTFLVVVFLAMIPFALNWIVAGVNLPETLIGDVAAVERGAAPSRSIGRLKAYLEEDPGSEVVLASLGGYYKRTGEMALARGYLERAIGAHPESAVLHNNLGNVLFLTGDLTGALKHYDRAADKRPDLAEPYYNLSRAYSARLDLDKAREHRRDANRLDAEGVRRWIKMAKTGRARDAVIDIPLPDKWLRAAIGKRDGHELREAAETIWENWGGVGSTGAFPYVGAGVIALMVLLLLLRGKIYISGPCVRCGRPVCRRCNSELPDDTTCGQCFHAFSHKDQVDAKSRIAKEIQIRHYRLRKERLARFITFVLPGVGQMVKDRPLRGALFLAVSCCVLTQVLLGGDGLMVDPHSLGTGIDWIKFVPLMILFAGTYAWAVLDAFRAET